MPQPLRRTTASLAACLAATVILAGCSGDELTDDNEGAADTSERGELRISGQSFPEAALMAAMYDELLTAAGFETEVELVDTRDVYMQEFPDQVDVVPEYVGGIVDFVNTEANGPDAEPLTTADAQESIDEAAELLDEREAVLLTPSEATDTNAFFVTQEYAEANGVSTLSDLEGESVVLAAAPDCEGRQDCAAGLEEVYGIDVTEILPLGFASDQTYQSVLDGESQLGLTSTTDGTLESQGLVLLEDDQQIQPAQNLVPMVSAPFLEEHPDLPDLLEPLMEALTTEELTELNGRVSVDREQVEDVARDYLVEEGLLEE